LVRKPQWWAESKEISGATYQPEMIASKLREKRIKRMGKFKGPD
jgi:hypothetical protein